MTLELLLSFVVEKLGYLPEAASLPRSQGEDDTAKLQQRRGELCATFPIGEIFFWRGGLCVW